MKIEIRSEETKDIEQIRGLLRTAFPGDAERKLVDLLRANGKAIISLVAVNGENVFGHILFSPVSTTPPGATKGIGLAPVAVLPDVQGQGIGSQLIRAGLRLCKGMGYDYCVVLGAPEYYRRFGFEKASRFDIQNEYWADEEFMITRFSGCHAVGLVRYAGEFAGLFV
jgi:putative acetyltransferase